MKKFILHCILLFSLLPFTALAADNRDVVIILDTSLSMEGYNNFSGRDPENAVFQEVKEAIQEQLPIILRPDDSYTFMTFGESVKEGVTSVVIDKDTDIETFSGDIQQVEAKDIYTSTLSMVQRLKLKMLEQQELNPNNQRLAIIFTDAKNDPPRGQTQALKAFAESSGLIDSQVTGHVYYFSLSTEFSDDLTQLLLEYFPDANIKAFAIQAGGDGFEIAKRLFQENLTPSLSVQLRLAQTGQLDPGQNYDGSLKIAPNYEAKNLSVSLSQTVQEEESLEVKFDQDTSTLALDQDEIEIPMEVEVPWSAEGKEFTLGLSTILDTDNEYFIRDENGNEVAGGILEFNVSVRDATLIELVQHNLYYTIPTIILLLILLFVLYKLLRYVLFVPRLNLNYWEQIVEDSEVVDKNKIDLGALAKGTYLFTGNKNAECFLHLPALKTTENFSLLKKGKKRRPIALLRNASEKMRFTNLKKFKGRRLKNGTSFKMGTYTFEVDTNIK